MCDVYEVVPPRAVAVHTIPDTVDIALDRPFELTSFHSQGSMTPCLTDKTKMYKFIRPCSFNLRKL